MADNSNTIAGWVLGAGIVALGLSIVSGGIFSADVPETFGYAVEEDTSGAAEADAGPPLEALLASADISKGEAVFKKCVACHTIIPGGANGIGPNLHGIMGAKHSAVAGFAYSDALKAIPGSWDWKAMDEWLTNPKKYAPGTKMAFAGLGKAEDRANILVYMNAQGSNLALPDVPVAEVTPEAATEDAGADVETVEATGDAAEAVTIEPVDEAAPEAAAEETN